jgi:Leucine-rich repeat (LRR) protein
MSNGMLYISVGLVVLARLLIVLRAAQCDVISELSQGLCNASSDEELCVSQNCSGFVVCDQRGFVIRLLRYDINYIPASMLSLFLLSLYFFFLLSSQRLGIGELSALSRFDLSTTHLTGTLPKEMSSLTSLTYLDISSHGLNESSPHGLTGTIPSELGRMISLLVFIGSSNRLTGTLPLELAQLPNLVYLNISNNHLVGTLPIQWTTSLISLSLSHNAFIGPLPAEIFNLRLLSILELSYNQQLNGTISARIANLTNLVELSLDNCDFSGSVPSDIGQLRSLSKLALAYNKFSGIVRPEFGQLRNLTRLSLSANQFSGTIPKELGELKELGILDMAYCDLTGSIPTDIGSLPKLFMLILFANGLSGPIPHELGNLTNLYWLDFSFNQLEGTVPTEIGYLKNINRLGLSSNKLSGEIPTHIGNLNSAIDIRLAANNFSGSIPPQIGQLTSLIDLSIASNSLVGTIPNELALLPVLNRLLVSFNRFTSSVAKFDGQFGYPALETLDIAGNFFTDAVITSMPKLRSLFLRYNLFSSIDIQNCSSLETIDASYNSLTTFPGFLFESMGLDSLKNVHLKANLINDMVPRDRFFNSELSFIDLSNNYLNYSKQKDILQFKVNRDYCECFPNATSPSIILDMNEMGSNAVVVSTLFFDAPIVCGMCGPYLQFNFHAAGPQNNSCPDSDDYLRSFKDCFPCFPVEWERVQDPDSGFLNEWSAQLLQELSVNMSFITTTLTISSCSRCNNGKLQMKRDSFKEISACAMKTTKLNWINCSFPCEITLVLFSLPAWICFPPFSPSFLFSCILFRKRCSYS